MTGGGLRLNDRPNSFTFTSAERKNAFWWRVQPGGMSATFRFAGGGRLAGGSNCCCFEWKTAKLDTRGHWPARFAGPWCGRYPAWFWGRYFRCRPHPPIQSGPKGLLGLRAWSVFSRACCRPLPYAFRCMRPKMLFQKLPIHWMLVAGDWRPCDRPWGGLIFSAGSWSRLRQPSAALAPGESVTNESDSWRAAGQMVHLGSVSRLGHIRRPCWRHC